MSVGANTFKAALVERRRQIGLWCSLASSIAAEVVSYSGFDWLLLDSEHSPNEIPDLLAQLHATSQGTASAVVRPPSNDPVTVKRILDLGARTVLIPYVQSPKEAELAVSSTRYPPKGIRGVSASSRASRYGRVADYLRTADEDICVLVQVETREALCSLAEIAAVPGVDGVFIGPSDLAASLGHIGNPQHPIVQQALQEAVQTLEALGKPAGILTTNVDEAQRYIGWGYQFVAVGTDVNLLVRESEKLVRTFEPHRAKAAPGQVTAGTRG